MMRALLDNIVFTPVVDYGLSTMLLVVVGGFDL
jgi:hypothetical protein